MPIYKTNRTEILEKAFILFQQKGYFHTSMNDVAQSCGLYKGSLYHYFPSKEIMMEQILIMLLENLRKKVFSIAYDETLIPTERLRTFLEQLELHLYFNQGGCLVGRITFEAAAQVPEFQTILRTIFSEWTDALTYIYNKRHYEDKAKLFAHQTLIELEGAIMLSQVFDDKQLLKDTYNRALMRLNIE